ncbi:hypothetical protein ACFWVM_29260 [Nocardia fluminea]|uniref:hypothetical protein n=1 Tax=Nocardia fluminea TaxID=134984 RepID=UPI003668FE22
MIEVRLTETVNYHSRYTREEVVYLLTAHGQPAPYQRFPDAVLANTFRDLLNDGVFALTDLVNTRGESQSEVISTDYAITGGLMSLATGGHADG